jgi:hypothetical protein
MRKGDLFLTAMMPGRPFVNNLKSKYSPNLGFNSIPMYISYKTEPVTFQHLLPTHSPVSLTTKLPILLMSRTQVSFCVYQAREQKSCYICRNEKWLPMPGKNRWVHETRDGQRDKQNVGDSPSEQSVGAVLEEISCWG